MDKIIKMDRNYHLDAFEGLNVHAKSRCHARMALPVFLVAADNHSRARDIERFFRSKKY